MKAHSKFVNKAKNNVCLVEMKSVESEEWGNPKKIDTLGKMILIYSYGKKLFSCEN